MIQQERVGRWHVGRADGTGNQATVQRVGKHLLNAAEFWHRQLSVVLVLKVKACEALLAKWEKYVFVISKKDHLSLSIWVSMELIRNHISISSTDCNCITCSMTETCWNELHINGCFLVVVFYYLQNWSLNPSIENYTWFSTFLISAASETSWTSLFGKEWSSSDGNCSPEYFLVHFSIYFTCYIYIYWRVLNISYFLSSGLLVVIALGVGLGIVIGMCLLAIALVVLKR